MVNREEIKRLLYKAEQCLIIGDNLTAEVFSREVIKLDPKNAESHYFLGEALCKQRRFAESIQALQRARKILPGNARIIHLLGWAIFMSEDVDLGRVYIKQALKVLPRDVQILSDLAVLEMGQGNMDEAKENILRALDIDPNNPLAQEVLQKVLSFSKAKKRLERKAN